MIDDRYELHNVYKPMYVDYNMLQVGMRTKYRMGEDINLSLSANYYNYDLEQNQIIEEVLYKPDFDVNVNAQYVYDKNGSFR